MTDFFRHLNYENGSISISIGCPFDNGLAEFLSRCTEEYAEEFCKRGCDQHCYWEMIAENRKTYNHRINILDTQKRMDDYL